MRLFVQRGFDHVTVAEVAAEAGLSEKTVFNYFPTKEDLFFDEVPERARRSPRRSARGPTGSRSSPRSAGCSSGECARLTSPGFATLRAHARGVAGPAGEGARDHVAPRAGARRRARGRGDRPPRRPDRRLAPDQRPPAVLPRRAHAGARRQARPRRGAAAAERSRACVHAARARARRARRTYLRPRRPPELIAGSTRSVRSGS